MYLEQLISIYESVFFCNLWLYFLSDLPIVEPIPPFQCAFSSKLKSQLILLFNLFLLLFIGHTALFGTIHWSHCTIAINFNFYLQYFQQKKKFSFNKISGSQTNPQLKISCIDQKLPYHFLIIVFLIPTRKIIKIKRTAKKKKYIYIYIYKRSKFYLIGFSSLKSFILKELLLPFLYV